MFSIAVSRRLIDWEWLKIIRDKHREANEINENLWQGTHKTLTAHDTKILLGSVRNIWNKNFGFETLNVDCETISMKFKFATDRIQYIVQVFMCILRSY